MPPLVLTQVAVAAVWLYEGLWCKLLGGVPHQFDVVEAVPLFDARSAAWILRTLGVIECGLALWVLSGWQPVLAAAAQTGLLVTMNSGGLLWARRIIPDPAGMVVKNFAFLVLAWVVAAQAGLAHPAG
jgi:DoxX-like protein